MRKLEKRLEKIAKSLGLRQEFEYQINRGKLEKGKIGEVDFVWLKDIPQVGPVPIVGFEIETSKRTSKHLKGDVFNLLCLNSAVGVVLFTKKGFDESKLKRHVAAVKRYSKTLSTHSKIFAWTEDDITELENEMKKNKVRG